MHVKPYLYFNGRTDEALKFYRQALGAEVLFSMRFGDSPDKSSIRPGTEDKIMHATFRIGDSEIMASDGICDENVPATFAGISLTVYAANIDHAEQLFAALGDGGHVQMPMTETFFSPRFGMVADRFGVSWMVLVEQPPEG
ncbi:MAG: VOC family protein [Pirellulaceae bacterium]|nr:VOC family protein [Planctomycetales bacterium]